MSYLCSGYKQIFNHMAPNLGAMADLIRQGRPVPEIMQLVRQQQEVQKVLRAQARALMLIVEFSGILPWSVLVLEDGSSGRIRWFGGLNW